MKPCGGPEDEPGSGLAKNRLATARDSIEQLKRQPRDVDRSFESRIEGLRRGAQARGRDGADPFSLRQTGFPLAQKPRRAVGALAVLDHAVLALVVDRSGQQLDSGLIGTGDARGLGLPHNKCSHDVQVVQLAEEVLHLLDARLPNCVLRRQEVFDDVTKPLQGNPQLVPPLRRLGRHGSRV